VDWTGNAAHGQAGAVASTRLSAMLSATEDPRAVVAFKAGDVLGKATILAAGDEVS
jgi:hypothetical protein